MSKKKCCVPGCPIDKQFPHKTRFHVRDPKLHEIWRKAIPNPLFEGKTLNQLRAYYVCGRHFEKKYFNPYFYPGGSCNLLVRNAVPTLHLPDKEYLKQSSSRNKAKSTKHGSGNTAEITTHNSANSAESTSRSSVNSAENTTHGSAISAKSTTHSSALMVLPTVL